MRQAAIQPVHRSTIRLAVLGIALLSATYGCGAPDKATTDSVAGGSAADSANAGAGGAMAPDSGGAGASTWQAACSLEATPPAGMRACRGVTNATFLQDPTYDELKQVLENADGKNTLKSAKGAHRTMACTSCERQYTNSWVNRDNRNYALSDLPADRTVLVGALTAPSNSRWDDGYYGVGKGLKGNGGSDTRKIFIFATRTTATTNPTYGKVVADFHFATTDGRRVTVVSGRRVVECTQPHSNRSTDTISAFVACESIAKIDAIATKLKMTFEEVLDHFNKDTKVPPTFDDFVKSISAKGLTLSAPELAQLQTQYRDIDPSDAPYWFACANGCCTAEMIN